MSKAGPRKGTQKEKKKTLKTLTALPVRKKLVEEEAKKVNDKAKKLFDRRKDRLIVSRMQNYCEKEARKKRTSVMPSSDEEDKWFCVVCVDTYDSKPGEKWVKCSYCEH